MFKLQITVMAKFTEIYTLRLNVVRETNVIQKQNVLWDNLISNFYGEQIEFITKIHVC